ncbi:uncharacterized protein LOC120077396 [Benincasa hispida]|uniref:uncharacterized protein LOC120077396 n=1 Tax=Benincasa hispida TaxID=102211 RepID=UPI0019001BD9|nr:uncharacterized protein LOC120077396 [Benincasa hispida]
MYRESRNQARQFKIPPHDRFPGQTTSLSSHIGTTNKIVKEKLTPTMLALFKKTIFGRFIDMDIIFNSPLVHYILLREVENHRKDAMTFDLNGTVVTFTKEDFLLGNGIMDIHIGTLETVYKEMEFENDMDVLKMTLVYYTKLAMMGREKARANVDKILLIDVKDLDYLNSMDWENVLWERTLLGLQRGLSDKSKNYEKRSKIDKNYIVKYNLPRFSHAFQCGHTKSLQRLSEKLQPD